MKPKRPQYEFPIAGSAWTRGAGHPAAIFLLDGRCHIAAFSSPAEQELRERGAIHVANLRFDRDPLEGRPRHPVRPLRAGDAVRRFARSSRN